MDKQWFYVGKKSEPRWLSCAIDHAISTILACIFSRGKNDVFKQLKASLEPFDISRRSLMLMKAFAKAQKLVHSR